MALAVVLPGALPMEFPAEGEGLFNALIKQGFDRAQILSHLAIAAGLTPISEVQVDAKLVSGPRAHYLADNFSSSDWSRKGSP
jgi:hypothetical protein